MYGFSPCNSCLSCSHFHCEACASESLANLIPQAACPTCWVIPYKIFISPPVRHKITQQILTEGFRR